MKKLLALMAFCGLTVAADAQKYVGGDISLLPSYEAAGAQYYDQSGNPIDSSLDFFAQEGMNAMRVRLFVNPDNAPEEAKGQGVRQDIDYILPLAKAIKAKGMRLLLDFHYSDTWADPSSQWTPAAWQGLDDDALADSVAGYTRRILQRLADEGASPDFIQPGNEISYGLLWGSKADGYGKACYPDAARSNWQRFATLLSKAIGACRATCPEAKIVLHTERVSLTQQADNANYAALSKFVDYMAEFGIDYDIIGLSYYPYFHGALTELEGAIARLETACPDKDLMLVETGYPYAWAVPGTTYDATTAYPYTAEGQRQFAEDLVAMLNGHNRVKGLFWWWMEANEYGIDWTSAVTGSWYNAPLFDNRDGRATPALGCLRRFVEGQTGVSSVPVSELQPSAPVFSIDGKRLACPPAHGIWLTQGQKKAR